MSVFDRGIHSKSFCYCVKQKILSMSTFTNEDLVLEVLTKWHPLPSLLHQVFRKTFYLNKLEKKTIEKSMFAYLDLFFEKLGRRRP